MNGNIGQVTEDDVELFLLLLVLVKPLESIVSNNFVILSLVIVQDRATGRPAQSQSDKYYTVSLANLRCSLQAVITVSSISTIVTNFGLSLRSSYSRAPSPPPRMRTSLSL